MLHIILLILKIIGILLLAVLGMLLLVLLTALLVPIRYQVAIEHGEAFFMKGRANWLLHLIHVNFSHIDGVFHIKARLCGFVLYDSLKPKVPKKTTTKRKTSARDKKKRKQPKKVSTELSKIKTPIAIKKQTENGIELSKTNSYESKSSSNVKEQAINEMDQVTDAKEQAINEMDQVTDAKEQVTNEREYVSDEKEQVTNTNEAKKEEKVSFIKKIISKMKSFKEKITKSWQKLKAKIISSFMTLTRLKQKLGLINDFIKDEINRDGFQITYKSLKRLLKHIVPTKLRSRLVFGTGDPCSTGQALGVLGILYSFYGDKIHIIPDFENSRLEGKHFARGRIRLVTILIIVGKLILDKRFKQLKKNFIILKEAL